MKTLKEIWDAWIWPDWAKILWLVGWFLVGMFLGQELIWRAFGPD